jgi:hypothetical protein
MENIKYSINVDSFPFGNCKHVSDLLYVDVPILSLFKFNDNFYLRYLVDDEDLIDTYMFFRVVKDDFFRFLTGKLSLLKLIKNCNDLVCFYDEDSYGKIIKTVLVTNENILNDYLPDEESFFNFEFDFSLVPELSKEIDEFKVSEHTKQLRKNAVYLKFSTPKSKHVDIIPFDEIAKTLPKFQKSYSSYAKALFELSYQSKITEKKKYKSTYNKVIDLAQYNIVDVKYGSFEIGLNYDEVMVNNPKLNTDFINWAKSVPKKFEKEVINYNPDDIELNKLIDNQFTVEQKAEIYKPIIEVVNNKKLQFSVKSKDKNNYKVVATTNFLKFEAAFKTLKTTLPSVEEIEEFEIVQVTAIVPKGKEFNSIKIENNLFSHVDEVEYKITQKDFDLKGYNYTLESELIVKIKSENGKIEFSTVFDGESITYYSIENNTKIGVEKLTEKLYEYIKTNLE